ncbi:MAG: guanylate kinase [Phycisphaerae bacterium]|nr:guanylate kinase [Phycisphaerae bacterium]
MSSDTGSSRGNERGRLVVISGPSGTGKSSICDALLERLPNAVWSVSVTTRRPRPGDVDGKTYRFVDAAEFDRRAERGEFLEWAEYCGQRYGTPRRAVEEAVASGNIIVLEIDVQGGIQVARAMPESIRIFILPPDPATLRARLEGRRTEGAEELQRRLEKADGEIAVARDSGCYPHFVVNDDLEESIGRVLQIIRENQAI